MASLLVAAIEITYELFTCFEWGGGKGGRKEKKSKEVMKIRKTIESSLARDFLRLKL